MSIISKIKASVESATGYTLHYYDESTINEVLDANPLPCAFYYLRKDTELLVDGEQNRERANVAVFFVNKTEFDFNSADNETIIEAVKTKGNIWLRSLMADSALKISEGTQVRTTRLYNQFDVILTGIGFNITLEEVYGFNACTDTEYTPTHKLILIGDGLFDVHNYYWVEVNIPKQTKNITYTDNGVYEVTPDTGYLMSKVNVTVDAPALRPKTLVEVTSAWITAMIQRVINS